MELIRAQELDSASSARKDSTSILQQSDQTSHPARHVQQAHMAKVWELIQLMDVRQILQDIIVMPECQALTHVLLDLTTIY